MTARPDRARPARAPRPSISRATRGSWVIGGTCTSIELPNGKDGSKTPTEAALSFHPSKIARNRRNGNELSLSHAGDRLEPSRSSLSVPSHRGACRNKLQARASAGDFPGAQERLLRGPRRELYGRRRSAASCVGRHPQRLSRFRCTACACRSAARIHSTKRISNAFVRSSNATSPRWSPSIWPGRPTRRAYFNDLLPLPYTCGHASTVSAITSTKSRRRSAKRCCSKIPPLMSLFARLTMSETEFIRVGRREQDAVCYWTSTTSSSPPPITVFGALNTSPTSLSSRSARSIWPATRTERRRGRSSSHRQP